MQFYRLEPLESRFIGQLRHEYSVGYKANPRDPTVAEARKRYKTCFGIEHLKPIFLPEHRHRLASPGMLPPATVSGVGVEMDKGPSSEGPDEDEDEDDGGSDKGQGDKSTRAEN